MTFNTIKALQHLIRCKSVTPNQAQALDYIESFLKPLGFNCHRLVFEDVDNLYARLGTQGPHFCFAGHVDVVPAGDTDLWSHGPFEGIIESDHVYGRGAVDMKGAIAAFMGALNQFLKEQNVVNGSISLMITSDEEGIALHGTQKILAWLQERKETIDHCLVGEPSSQAQVGDTIKTGRLGSLNTTLTCYGTQGHVAYPAFADNPIPRLLHVLSVLNQGPPELPSLHFNKSHVEITTIDVNNPTVNVTPSNAKAGFNIRFNDQQTQLGLKTWITSLCDAYAKPYDVIFQTGVNADICKDKDFYTLIEKSVFDVTGITPIPSTVGGTSDARFIKNMCSVFELGLVSKTMHQVNECVSMLDLKNLEYIYKNVLCNYFKS